MNPLLASMAFGFLKGLVREGPVSQHGAGWVTLGAPVIEELQFRAAPALGGMPPGVSAVAFAAAHVQQERRRGMDAGLGRFADTLAGGLLYEMAFKRWGLKGAVAAHMAHNVACYLGAASRPSRKHSKRGKR